MVKFPFTEISECPNAELVNRIWLCKNKSNELINMKLQNKQINSAQVRSGLDKFTDTNREERKAVS